MSFGLLFPQICRANQGSPVYQRAPELGNGTWFTDNRQQKIPQFAENQRRFIWLTPSARKPSVSAFRLCVQKWRCTEDRTLISTQTNPWRTSALFPAGARLCPVATARSAHLDSPIKKKQKSDCDWEHGWNKRDALCPQLVPLVNAAPGDVSQILWQRKRLLLKRHSTLWNEGNGPRRS